jgi:polar amino acid transport system substrate-binding protein
VVVRDARVHRPWRRLVLGLFALLAIGPARAETLVIAGDIWCPINCAPESAKPGIFVELARDIFAEAGIQVEYRVINWARAISDARTGKLNAVIGAGIQDAPDFLYTPTAPGISRMCFYVAQGAPWRYQGLGSLAQVRLGTINSYSYGQEIDAYVRMHRAKGDRVQVVSGEQALEMNVEKVRFGRLDATVENSWVMENLLARTRQQDRLQSAGCRAPDVPIYLAFSPAIEASARYNALFEAGLQRYRASGRLDALMRSYGVTTP